MENKHKPEGVRIRIELLRRYYERTYELITYAKTHSDLKRCMDDVIDALCLAVTGMIGFENGFKSIPENPMQDKQGILMQVVYAETAK